MRSSEYSCRFDALKSSISGHRVGVNGEGGRKRRGERRLNRTFDTGFHLLETFSEISTPSDNRSHWFVGKGNHAEV